MDTFIFDPRRFKAAVAIAVLAGSTAAHAQTVLTEIDVILPAAGDIATSFGAKLDASAGRLAVASSDADQTGGSGRVIVFDGATRSVLHTLTPDPIGGQNDGLFGRDFDLEGDRLLVGRPRFDGSRVDSGAVYLFDAATGQQLAVYEQQLPAPQSEAEFGVQVVLNGDEAVIAAVRGGSGGVGSLNFIDITTGIQTGRVVGPRNAIEKINFGSPFANELAVYDGTILASTYGGLSSGNLESVNSTGTIGIETTFSFGRNAIGFNSAFVVSGDLALASIGVDPDSGCSPPTSVFLIDLSSHLIVDEWGPGTNFCDQSFGKDLAIDDRFAMVTLNRSFSGSDPDRAFVYDTDTGRRLAELRSTDGFDRIVDIEVDGDLAFMTVGENWLFGPQRVLVYDLGQIVICPADVNGDGLLSPADFTAWILAFNDRSPACDQNGDGACTPADFTAWVIGFNAGCGG
ncbi:MAG: GC-type dockerin domain-anchored protein [Planctomycetota bacterium]